MINSEQAGYGNAWKVSRSLGGWIMIFQGKHFIFFVIRGLGLQVASVQSVATSFLLGINGHNKRRHVYAPLLFRKFVTINLLF